MRRAGALLALSVLALLAACGDNEPALPPVAEKKEKLTRFEFAIEGVRYAISLPEQAGMREAPDPKRIIFDAGKHQRLQRIMILGAVPDGLRTTFDRQHRIRGTERVLRYRKIGDAGGGSGGGIATIDGEFEIGLYKLFLYCSDQSEWTLYPDWCLEYLETLEPISAPSGNG